MVLNFALSLSFDGIVLLHRVRRHWVPIGEVSLTTETLDADMAELLERGLAVRQGARRVGLILPNEQIRYLDTPDPGEDEAVRDAAIRTALEGATPYAVDELDFDFAHRGDRLLIAAVARETLEEAEQFALDHGFRPVAYLAIAPQDAFEGAVFFGIPDSWTGPVRPERPAEAIRILPPDAESDQPPAIAATPAAAGPSATAAPPMPEPEAPTPVETAPVDSSPEEHGPPEFTPEEALPETPLAGAPEPAPPASDPPASTPPTLNEPRLAAFEQEQDPPEPETAAEDTADGPQAPEPSAPAAAPVTRPRAPVPPVAAPLATRSPDPAPQSAAVPAPVAARRDAGSPPKPSFSSIRASREGPGAAPKLGPPPGGQDGERRFTPLAAPLSAKADALPEAPPSPGSVPEPPAHETAHRTPASAGTAPDTSGKPDTSAQDDSGHDLTGAGAFPAPDKRKPAPEAPLEVAPAPPVKPMEPLDDVPEMPAYRIARAGLDQPKAKPASRRSGLGRIAAFRAGQEAEPPAPPMPDAGGSAVLDARGTRGFATTSDAERERMTVFGARNRDNVGGKPRFLGLMLTLALLLFLAGVAAWASVFLDDGIARLFRSDDEPRAVASLPEPAPEPAAALPTPPAPDTTGGAEAEEEDLRIAALETMPDAGTTDAPAPVLSEPREAVALTPEEADATYAATGIWQRAPSAPHALPDGTTEDIYVASIDPSVRQFDAVALPAAQAIAPEAAMEDPGLPPPSDMVFDFDARGLIRATAEGALTPDGLRIFSGQPAAVPPLRREAALTAPDQRSDAAPAPESPLARVRPEARPDDVVEQSERVELRGISRDELAALRPVLRPQTAQEEAQAEDPQATATAQAVARSLIPVPRPRNMEVIVQRAQRAEERQEVQVASAATVAPRVVQPPAPSATSVARAATVRNAIRLNQVNLIGVYGAANNRRALVRMPNGRYEKVKVGDRLDGGRVTAIGEAALQYQKGGRTVTLDMPRG